jgi:GTP-binding protein EngB required for normal cell division
MTTNSNSKTVQITLTEEQVSAIAKILSTRGDRSEKEIIDLIVERGIYALVYRTKYNKVKYTREQAMREEFKAFKAAKASGSLSSVSSVVAAPKK